MRANTLGAALLAAAVTVALPATAQDMNTLNRHLEMQQWQRVQDHQNRNRTSPSRQQRRAASECTTAALPAEARRQMEAEYSRRLTAQGREQADVWARDQGRRFRATRPDRC